MKRTSAKFGFAFVACLLLMQIHAHSVGAQSLDTMTGLVLGPQDLRLENSNDGGYLLYVRAKPQIKSILITESTEPESHKIPTYTMRTKQANPINNDSKRMLNGVVLDQPALFFLVTSTSLPDKAFGQAFRLFIPYVVEYGFPGGRHGDRQIVDGAFLSIRTFNKVWADYSGAYHDNPFKFVLTQSAPKELIGDGFNKEAVNTFKNMAMKGELYPVSELKNFMPTLSAILDTVKGSEVDLVLCIDATGSMEPYQPFVRKEIVPLFQKFLQKHPAARFAFVQYRDYYEQFVYQLSPFTSDFSILQTAMNHYRPLGGGDIPEAVDEALYAALSQLKWQSPRRLIILVGDAPPHPLPRGKISHAIVNQELKDHRVDLVPLILPSVDRFSAKP